MKMPIDESISWIDKAILDMRRAEICISDRLALETAIDTMCKYQKILEILKDIHYGGDATVRRIQEVVENGTDE